MVPVPPPEDNMPPPPTPTPKDQEPTQGKKTTTTTTKPAPEQSIKCPRCDSPNTKFCYYNNYSLTQPRHFCKTCRRYWTNGGALRNVPIGGGCRKNKRVKPSSSSSSSRFSTEFSLHGLNVPPSIEFNLGALPFPSRLNTNHHHHHHIPTPTTGLFNNQFSSFGADVNSVSATNGLSLSGFQLDPPASNSLMGLASADLWPALGRAQSSTLSDPLTSPMQSMQQQPMQQPSMNVHSSLASSIESLSSINHDLHLKMQQQRLATMMYGGDSHNKGGDVSLNGFENQKLLNPVMFQNLEISKPEESLPAGSSLAQGPSGETTVTAATPTEWFFGNSSFPSVTTTPSTSNGGANGNNNNINDIANNNWSTGTLAWGDLQHQPFSALP